MLFNTTTRPARRVASLLGAGLLGASSDAFAAWDLNMTQGVTPVSHIVYDLHMLILWVCVVIGIVVFGAMFWSIIWHRKSAGREAAHFHHSTLAEIAWTIVPVIILVTMAVPATRTLIAMEDTSDADMTIKVTGYQWKWHYDYVDNGVSFYSNLAPASRAAIHGGNPAETPHYLLDVDNPLVIPTGKKVLLQVTGADVIHAWWVPAFGMKKDAIPGYVNEMWIRAQEPGTYRGQCAELCGKDHGFMPIVVKVVPQADYDAWVSSRKQADAGTSSVAMARSD